MLKRGAVKEPTKVQRQTVYLEIGTSMPGSNAIVHVSFNSAGARQVGALRSRPLGRLFLTARARGALHSKDVHV